jgi:hypothetical protein
VVASATSLVLVMGEVLQMGIAQLSKTPIM